MNVAYWLRRNIRRDMTGWGKVYGGTCARKIRFKLRKMDFNVQMDHVIEARWPNVIIIDKVKKLCQIVDFAVPYDTKVNTKEVGKIENCQDLARELRKLWNMKVSNIPVIVEALGATSKNICKRMEDIAK